MWAIRSIFLATIGRNLINKPLAQYSRNMAQILDGLKLSKLLNEGLKTEVDEWVKAGNRQPHLACILIGNDPASVKYVAKKEQAAKSIGIQYTLHTIQDISQTELIDMIHKFNEDSNVDGILVQLPVPESMDERTVCNAVCPSKDVDGFHIENVGKFCLDMIAFEPCTAIGVLEIIKHYKIETHGKNVVVVGRSKNVGMPIAMFLHSDARHESHKGMDATVTICHRYTPRDQLAHHCKHADIIVSATGIPKLITADMIKPGAAVIDVGLTQITCPETNRPKIVGDVDFDNVKNIAGAITPVPGGVGPLTVAMLMRNIVKAAKNIKYSK